MLKKMKTVIATSSWDSIFVLEFLFNQKAALFLQSEIVPH